MLRQSTVERKSAVLQFSPMFFPIIAFCGIAHVDKDGVSFHPFIIILWWLYISPIATGSEAYIPGHLEKYYLISE